MARPATRILLVEDDAPLRAVVAEVLREDGYAVAEAADGRATLDAMRDIPDAVVLDLHMPDLDGPGLVQALRDHRPWRCVPLLVLSGAARAEDAAERLGAEGLVRKPFNLDELMQRRGIAGNPKPAAPQVEIRVRGEDRRGGTGRLRQ